MLPFGKKKEKKERYPEKNCYFCIAKRVKLIVLWE